MSRPIERPYQNLDSSELEKVRQELEQKSKETRAGISRPTEIGLSDTPPPLKYCVSCGASHEEPFGNYQIAARLNAHGVSVEVYPCGGVIIRTESDVTVSTRRSSGPGTSGQLGYTRTVLTPYR